MITNQSAAELVAIGMGQQAAHLVQQAGCTLTLAAEEGPGMAALLPAGFLDEMAQLRDEVVQAMQDASLLADEGRELARSPHAIVRQIKEWHRRVASRCLRAILAGIRVPEVLIELGHPRTVAAVLEGLHETIALLNEYADELAALGPPIVPMIDEGRTLYSALEHTDIVHEQTRYLPASSAAADFAAKKGKLYLGLKIINEAGHELCAGNPETSSRYNLSLLYRRQGEDLGRPPAPAPEHIAEPRFGNA